VPIVVVANKSDMPEDAFEVTEVDIQTMSKRLDVPIVMASARTGDNVESAFVSLVQKVVAMPVDTKNKDLVPLAPKEGGCCK